MNNTKLALVQTSNFLNNTKGTIKSIIDLSIETEKKIESIEPIKDDKDEDDLISTIKNVRYPSTFKKTMEEYIEDVEDTLSILKDDFDIYKENISIIKSNKKDENIKTSMTSFKSLYKDYNDNITKLIKQKIVYLESRENYYEIAEENYTMMLQIHRITSVINKLLTLNDSIIKSLEFTQK